MLYDIIHFSIFGHVVSYYAMLYYIYIYIYIYIYYSTTGYYVITIYVTVPQGITLCYIILHYHILHYYGTVPQGTSLWRSTTWPRAPPSTAKSPYRETPDCQQELRKLLRLLAGTPEHCDRESKNNLVQHYEHAALRNFTVHSGNPPSTFKKVFDSNSEFRGSSFGFRAYGAGAVTRANGDK